MRNNGRTTTQIREAPKGAIFLCHSNSFVYYAKRLANQIGRKDLIFKTVEALDNGSLKGIDTPVVIDHFAVDNLSKERYQALVQVVNARRRK